MLAVGLAVARVNKSSLRAGVGHTTVQKTANAAQDAVGCKPEGVGRERNATSTRLRPSVDSFAPANDRQLRQLRTSSGTDAPEPVLVRLSSKLPQAVLIRFSKLLTPSPELARDGFLKRAIPGGTQRKEDFADVSPQNPVSNSRSGVTACAGYVR